jgi:hypothetical protein
MKSLVLWLLTGTALVSMLISETELDATEIVADPGSPDPNIYADNNPIGCAVSVADLDSIDSMTQPVTTSLASNHSS